MFFPVNVVIFLNSSSSAAALEFDLPSEGLISLGLGYVLKNTIFNEQPVLERQINR